MFIIGNDKNNKLKEKNTLIDIIKYHFDNFISKSLSGMIIFLFIITIVFVLFISIPAIVIDANKVESQYPQLEIIYNNFATVINQWLPFSYDNDFVANKTFVVLITRVVIAVFGLLFTGVLIGIIGEVIENKIEELRQGRSKVIEHGHIVVMGYDERNHTLIKELILSTRKKLTILIIDEKEKEDIKEDVYTNIKVPSNIKLIIRTMKLWDVEGLKKCNIEESSAIVISPTSDINTLKIVFAVKRILKEYPNSKTHIVSGIKNEEYRIDFSKKEDIMFGINDLIARTIATSNHQSGISNVLTSVLSFEGSEFYIKSDKALIGRKFGDIVINMVNAMPIGLYRNEELIIPPKANEIILENDELLYYAEEAVNAKIIDNTKNNIKNYKIVEDLCDENSSRKKVLIIGYNEKIPIILNSFSKDVKEIIFTGITTKQKETINNIVTDKSIFEIRYCEKDESINNKEILTSIVNGIDHIIILKDKSINDELSDVNNMLLYLRLIKIRKKLNLHYTIITELNSNENKELIDNEDDNDFIVSSNVVAMVLAQLIKEPKLKSLFSQLLTDDGINISLKYTVDHKGYNGNVADLRLNLLNEGYILLGYIKNDDYNKFVYNPRSDEQVELGSDDRLILLGK